MGNKAAAIYIFSCLAFLLAPGLAEAKHAAGFVKMMHMKMSDGSTLDLEVVKVHGKMMVLVPEDKVYEALHQKPF